MREKSTSGGTRAWKLALRALIEGGTDARVIGKAQIVATGVVINAGQDHAENVAVPGAELGDMVVLNMSADKQLAAGLVAQPYVSIPGNVTVLVLNTSDAPITSDYTLNVNVLR